jgi:hypothetical protein
MTEKIDCRECEYLWRGTMTQSGYVVPRKNGGYWICEAGNGGNVLQKSHNNQEGYAYSGPHSRCPKLEETKMSRFTLVDDSGVEWVLIPEENRIVTRETMRDPQSGYPCTTIIGAVELLKEYGYIGDNFGWND